MSTKPRGYVLFETAWLVAIATGFNRKSVNRKTGPMVQIWILPRQLDPVQAQKLGKDKVVCGDCPLRPANVKPGDARCYVNTGHAPVAIWNAYHRGSYPRLESTDVFQGQAVRFGAYGDPTKLPLSLVQDIAAKSSRWTGYTHQWHSPLLQGYKPYFMASADDVENQIEATKAGWRTFRVAPKGSTFRLRDEISCPASKESGQKTTCAKCSLCAGTSKPAKSIVIQAH
jgi:hypothetical protein